MGKPAVAAREKVGLALRAGRARDRLTVGRDAQPYPRMRDEGWIVVGNGGTTAQCVSV